MANEKAIADAMASPDQPIIRTIGLADLSDALARGYADFKEMPSHLVLLCVIYPVVGLVAARLSFGYDILPILFPLISGFALVGPLAAIGLYELSRRRELGLDTSWVHMFDVLRSPSIRAIVALSVVMMVIYFAWLGAALFIYDLTFGGTVQESLAEFARQVFATAAGWRLIIVGCTVGFFFAIVVLSVSAVSFPMLVDRDVSALTAIQTSVRAVIANPITMAIWGFIVAGTLVIGSLPFFVGLAIVMPVLGHATWHLYRKVVEH